MATDITNRDDIIDSRDIIARIEELEPEVSALLGIDHDDQPAQFAEKVSQDDRDEPAELQRLYEIMADMCGRGGDEEWRGDWYPVTLIRDTYFVDAMQELCEDIGDVPVKGFPSYMVIDWEATAENLRADYSSVEFDGVTYWYR